MEQHHYSSDQRAGEGSNPLLTRGGLPLITYAPRGRGGVMSLIHFHCLLHAKKRGGGGGLDSM